MFHAFKDIEDHPGFVQEIKRLRDRGLIKYIGASIYTNEQFNAVLARDEFDLIQLPYNLLDNDYQRGELINRAHQLNKIVHVRSVFLQGLFFKDLASIQTDSVLYPIKKELEKVHQIARNADIAIAALALQYVSRNNHIDGVLIGIETFGQLETNLKELNVNIPENVFSEIDKIRISNKLLLLPINWK